jgi:putative DNA primase/helicase
MRIQFKLKRNDIMTYQNDSRDAKTKALDLARGNWEQYLSQFPVFSEAIEKAPRAAPCPSGNGSYRFFKTWQNDGGAISNSDGAFPNGLSLVTEYVFNGDFKEALKSVIQFFDGNRSDVPIPVTCRPVPQAKSYEKTPEEKQVCVEKINKCFLHVRAACVSPEIGKYMQSRGLKGSYKSLPNTLGFNPVLYYGDDNVDSLKLSGMLGIMQDIDNNNITMHRTYLDPKTSLKAKVSQPKQVMSSPISLNGLAIKLDQPVAMGDDVILGVSEGIETALAIREATGIPMWACYNNFLLEAVKIPEHVTMVVIYGDQDKSLAGQRSALKLAKRLMGEGKQVMLRIPTLDIDNGAEGIDWLENYLNEHLEAQDLIKQGLPVEKEPQSLNLPDGEKGIDWLDVYVNEGALAFEDVLDPSIAVKTGVPLQEDQAA